MGDINQHARTQTDAPEVTLVCSYRNFIITASSIVTPKGWIEPFLSEYFVVENINRLQVKISRFHLSFFTP